MWIIGGLGKDEFNYNIKLNDVWKSKDGIFWQQVTNDPIFPPRTMLLTFVFKNEL